MKMLIIGREWRNTNCASQKWKIDRTEPGQFVQPCMKSLVLKLSIEAGQVPKKFRFCNGVFERRETDITGTVKTD